MPKNATIRSVEYHGESGCSKPFQQDTSGQKETVMRERFSGSMIMAAIAAAAISTVIAVSITRTSAQSPALKTPWGEPDLQGIWTDETDTPLQRSPKYASQEFFTEAQRAELDRQRSAFLGRDRRLEPG